MAASHARVLNLVILDLRHGNPFASAIDARQFTDSPGSGANRDRLSRNVLLFFATEPGKEQKSETWSEFSAGAFDRSAPPKQEAPRPGAPADRGVRVCLGWDAVRRETPRHGGSPTLFGCKPAPAFISRHDDCCRLPRSRQQWPTRCDDTLRFEDCTNLDYCCANDITGVRRC